MEPRRGIYYLAVLFLSMINFLSVGAYLHFVRKEKTEPKGGVRS